MMPPRCCLTTPDPGAWKAGVDDSADPHMIDLMHKIRGGMNYYISNDNLIKLLKASGQLDSRTRLGGDIQRCLLSLAADRLMVLDRREVPYWRVRGRRLRARLADAWEIICGRAVCFHVAVDDT